MDQRDTAASDGYGDEQGTRVGPPDQSAPKQHADTPSSGAGKRTGMGSEATEGVHGARSDDRREPEDRTSLSDQETGRGSREGGSRAGSEPLEADPSQHRSGYGGAAGAPVTSTDQREGTRER
jgi:hypothetical protein